MDGLVTVRQDLLKRFLVGMRSRVPTPLQGGFTFSAWLFLRGLAIVHAVAFLSDVPQILGLLGSRGILPATAWLQSIREVLGRAGVWVFPTLASA